MHFLLCERTSFFLFGILLVMGMMFSIHFARMESYNQYILTVLSSIVCLCSFLYTGMIDPGIVWNEQLLHHKDTEMSDDSVYCSICDVYCPPHSYHCTKCNVCIQEYVLHNELMIRWDHHCSFFGFILSITTDA